MLYLRNTTEARKTEQALRRSEQLAAAGRLAASVAHEINNPLEAVTNLLFLAKMDRASPANQGPAGNCGQGVAAAVAYCRAQPQVLSPAHRAHAHIARRTDRDGAVLQRAGHGSAPFTWNAGIGLRRRWYACPEKSSRSSPTSFAMRWTRCPPRPPDCWRAPGTATHGWRRRWRHHRRHWLRHGRANAQAGSSIPSPPPRAKPEPASACGCQRAFSTSITPPSRCAANLVAERCSGFFSRCRRDDPQPTILN